MGEASAAVVAVLGNALKDISLAGITSEIIAVLPVVLPVAVTVLALRKGIRFLFGTLRGV